MKTDREKALACLMAYRTLTIYGVLERGGRLYCEVNAALYAKYGNHLSPLRDSESDQKPAPAPEDNPNDIIGTWRCRCGIGREVARNGNGNHCERCGENYQSI